MPIIIFADETRNIKVTHHKTKPSDEVTAIMKEKLHYEYDFYYFIRQRFFQVYNMLD